MDHYRLYFMSPGSGHIDRFESIAALDEGDAIKFAKMYIGSEALELWLGSQLVGTFDAHVLPALQDSAPRPALFQRAFAPLSYAHAGADAISRK